MKRGAEARLVSVSGQPLREVPAVRLAKEKVVDTTAAGDSFSAGYLAVRLTGGDAESAARRGHLTASTVIQYRGRSSRGKRCRSNSPHKALSGRRWRVGEALGYCPGGMSLALAVGVNRIGAAASRRGRRIRRHQFFPGGLQLLHIVFRFALRLLQHQRHVLRAAGADTGSACPPSGS